MEIAMDKYIRNHEGDCNTCRWHKRIKTRHRMLMLCEHPDRGGEDVDDIAQCDDWRAQTWAFR